MKIQKYSNTHLNSPTFRSPAFTLTPWECALALCGNDLEWRTAGPRKLCNRSPGCAIVALGCWRPRAALWLPSVFAVAALSFVFGVLHNCGARLRNGSPELRIGGPELRNGGPELRNGSPKLRHGGPDLCNASPDMCNGGP